MKTLRRLLFSGILLPTMLFAQDKLPVSSGGPVVFAHVTDIHIGVGTAEEDLERTVYDINANDTIEFVIITGDITEFGNKGEIVQAKKILDRLNKPWYIVPGNHDTKWSESGCNDFNNIFGGDTFSFQHKGTWFLGTNSGPNMRMGPGQTPRENIVWLEQQLKSIGKDAPIVYVNHYPQDPGLNNWYVVLDMLRGYNVKLFMCGHGHSNKLLDIEGVTGIMGRSNLRARDSIGGYNIVTIGNGKISYREKKPTMESQAPWYSGTWDPASRPAWNTAVTRPDFRVNDSFPSVRVKWMNQESADLGGGMAMDGRMTYYADGAGTISAVNNKSGKKHWTYKVNSKIYSTPVIHGKLLWVNLASGTIIALDKKTGLPKDSLTTNGALVSTPAIHGDTLFVAGSDGHCRAWHLGQRRLIWDFASVNNFVETRPLVKDGFLYFGSWGNEFYALETATGRLAWKWGNGSKSRMLAPAAVWPEIAAGKLFMVAPDRFMTALDPATGREIWRHQDKTHWVRESMGISRDSSLVFVKTTQGRVLAIDAASETRKVRWQAPVAEGFEIAPTPIVEYNNVVFVPFHSGLVVALDKNTGALIWKRKLTNCLVTSLLPAGKNKLLASTMDGMVAMLEW